MSFHHTHTKATLWVWAVHQSGPVPAAVWHLYSVFTRFPERPAQCAHCTRLHQTHTYSAQVSTRAYTRRQILTCASPQTHTHTHTVRFCVLWLHPRISDSAGFIFSWCCLCREPSLNLAAIKFKYKKTRATSLQTVVQIHFKMWWLSRSRAEGFQTWVCVSVCVCVCVCVCVWMDLMYRSWTAAQLKGFPRSRPWQWQKRASGTRWSERIEFRLSSHPAVPFSHMQGGRGQGE